jgi:hypothetical protein
MPEPVDAPTSPGFAPKRERVAGQTPRLVFGSPASNPSPHHLRPMSTPFIKLSFFGVVLALAASLPSVVAAEKEVDPSIAEFAALDHDLGRFERLIKQYDDPKYKGYIDEIFKVLKDRVDALHKAGFDQLKIDDLRFDINTQAQRLALEMAPLVTPPPSNEFALDLEEVNPNPANRNEVAIALAELDKAIARKEAKAKLLTVGRTMTLQQVEKVKQMRAALGTNFTKEGWLAAAKEMGRLARMP